MKDDFCIKIPIITELSMKKIVGCVVKKWVTALKMMS